MSTMRNCAACKYPTERHELMPVAGPDGTAWYCKDTAVCRERRQGKNTQPKEEEPTMATLPQHSRFGKWTPPADEEGDEYKARDHIGNHAIIRVKKYEPRLVTTNSPNGGPAIFVDVYDMNRKQAFKNVLMMTGRIVDSFKPYVGAPPFIIQWERRVPASGRPYPSPAEPDPRAEAAAERLGDVFAEIDAEDDADPFEGPSEGSYGDPAPAASSDPWADEEAPF